MVSITLIWALSNLLNHQEILKKARIEIDEKIGLDRLMDESDIVNLPYLQNVMFETLRLYPPAPLLLPHLSAEDCKVGGYDMPRGTMLLMNVWAMLRDPELWEEPELFKPERFDKEGETQKLYAVWARTTSMSWSWAFSPASRPCSWVVGPMFRVGENWCGKY